jgi:hypothetical protein
MAGHAWTRRTPPPADTVKVPRPGPRGWLGRGRGSATMVDPPPQWRATTVQACGLWPWAAGAGAPMVGVPMGRHLFTGATVCCDVINWFQRAHLISNPSAFALGNAGLGKSTASRRMAVGLAGYGVLPLVLGDLKPDYVAMTKALGGQVIELGHGRGYLNVLDPGEALEAADRLTGSKRTEVLAELHFRRVQMTEALIQIQRGTPPTDREDLLINAAMRLLADRHDGVPVLGDLLAVIRQAPAELRTVALDRGQDTRYQDITEDLEVSLMGLAGDGRLGATFSKPTSQPMRRDRPVVYDISTIDDSETDLQAAALLACWSSGFATVNIANHLADAGLEPQRHYFVILDELWRALRAGRGLVDRVDALTRLNRTKGVGQLMISHTMSDLESIPSEEDRKKAAGFVERAGLVLLGGLRPREMPMLQTAVSLSQREQDMLVSWQAPGSWNPRTDRDDPPPGVGKFLVKVSTRPGIPIGIELTDAEQHVHDTNQLWHEQSRIGNRDHSDADDVVVLP